MGKNFNAIYITMGKTEQNYRRYNSIDKAFHYGRTYISLNKPYINEDCVRPKVPLCSNKIHLETNSPHYV